MEPGEIISTAAQIAVALAGFAGVVVVFRRESVHDWPPLDKFRLRLLLTNSVLPLILCIIGLVLLGVRSVPSRIWRWCSGVAFCFISPWVITAIAVFYRSRLYRLQAAGCELRDLFVQDSRGRNHTVAVVQRCLARRILAVLRRDRFSPYFRGLAVCADDYFPA